jgi:hypothetical protein
VEDFLKQLRPAHSPVIDFGAASQRLLPGFCGIGRD